MKKRALVQNSADEEQVKSAKKKEEIRRDEELEDLRVVLSSVQGRRFLTRVLKACKPDAISMSVNPYETYFKQGQESVGAFLKQEIMQASFDGYLAMLVEEKKEEELNA